MKCEMRITAVTLLIFITFACTDSAQWYPAGDVNVVSCEEYVDQVGTKHAIVYYSIENTGDSTIGHSTVSFKLSTQSSEYFQTVVATTRILPSHRIWDSCSVALISPDETASRDKIEILDFFFE